MAIDRNGIIDKVFSGLYSPARSLVAPVVEGARDDPCGEPCTYQPEVARRLLAKAGGLKGPLVLWYNSGAGHRPWMRLVAAQLRRNLGIETVRFRHLSFDDYLDVLDHDKVTGPFRLGWLMDYPSPQNYLEPLYGSQGVSNRTRYESDAVDALLRKGDRANSVREGIEFYDRAEDRVLHDMPVVPLWFGKVECAHSPHVRQVHVGPTGLVDLAAVEVSRSR
jgi:ABC-type transport system substrate-binding protein